MYPYKNFRRREEGREGERERETLKEYRHSFLLL
jgi:hypothetical protein